MPEITREDSAQPAPRKRRRLGTVLAVPVVLTGVLAGWYGVRQNLLRPGVPEPDASLVEQAKRTRILRDDFGVAHAFGDTDADAAFAMAYAHAEDDWPTIQMVLIASRGELARVRLEKQAIINDFYVDLFDIRGEVERTYDTLLSEKTRAMLEGYARGLTYYACLHPEESDGRFLPITGRDLAAGFAHKLPLMLRIGKMMEKVTSAESLAVGQKIQWGVIPAVEMNGSNAHAVGKPRSADGIVRLNINSHQPWTGPVAWHEVHVTSGEGWNVTGGTFAGAPIVGVGHNDHLGWAHTFNHADQVDVYELEMHPEQADTYRLDGEWRKLEVREGDVAVDLALLDWHWTPRLLQSEHGPVIETDHGYYAFRVAGRGRWVTAAEQWYRMGKATTFEEWKDAMRVQGVPLFNTVYADRENVFYVYNGLMPIRKETDADGSPIDWHAVLPGDRSDLIWTDYVPFDELPQVLNPPSGFVQNCNSTPWQTTVGEGNPDRAAFSRTLGISDRMTNRAVRSIETFGADESITDEEFLAYKWDRAYSKDGPMWIEAIKPVLDRFEPKDAHEEKALEVLRAWDLTTEEDQAGASLAILTWRPIWARIILEHGARESLPDPLECFREAVAFLVEHHGRVDVPLGELQRLRWGGLDLPIGGGPDILNAMHGEERDGRLVGVAGDSYVLIVEFTDEGPRSRSIHNYGNVVRPGSKHYADQAPLFVKRQLKRVLRTEAEIREHLEREYRPGEELNDL